MIEARLLRSTRSPTGNTAHTFWLKYPRYIHSQLMTHRVFSRNTCSSRAIPVERLCGMVEAEPVEVRFAANQRGMVPGDPLEEMKAQEADQVWRDARGAAVAAARRLGELGVHKQWANRVLEPYAHVETLLTGTDFLGFFGLRCHADAQEEIQVLAGRMRALVEGEPILHHDTAHLPLGGGITAYERIVSCVQACARVSYLRGGMEGGGDELFWRLLFPEDGPPHASPFEHVLFPCEGRHGNLSGFISLRTVLDGALAMMRGASREEKMGAVLRLVEGVRL